MRFADLCWPALDDYRRLDPALYASMLAELRTARDRLARRHDELVQRGARSDRMQSSYSQASELDELSTVIDALARSLSRPTVSDAASVLDIVRIFAELDEVHVGEVIATYSTYMAECDEDDEPGEGDELDDERPDLSERAWEIGWVPRGRFKALMVIASALVAPQIANPNDCVARMREIVDRWILELAQLGVADDSRSAWRCEALEREVRALGSVLTSGAPAVETIARVLEVVGPLRWEHCANDLRLEFLCEGWGDEREWEADTARYELMTSFERALGL